MASRTPASIPAGSGPAAADRVVPGRAAPAGGSPPSREVALGSGSVVVSAGDFRVLTTTLPSGFRIAEHVHDRNNLAYTVAGGACETFRRERIQCRPGDVLLKPAGVAHSDSFERETVTLQLEWLPDGSRPASRALERVLLVRSGMIGAVAARLFAELQGRDEATPLIAEGMALEIVGHLLRGSTPRREPRVPRWLSRTRERLHEEPAAGQSIRGLAAAAGVHADYLARRFRHTYGTTVGAYARQVRVERAATELISSDRSLSEIALRAGFSDQAHFTREFKRMFGRPPGAYRREATVSAPRRSR